MSDPKISKFQFIQIFPFFIQAPPEVKKEFEAAAQYKKIPAGTTVFWEGDRCQSLALLISGQVRVYKSGESGREITLYRFSRGEGCILTLSCIMSDTVFPAIAQVVEDTEAFIIPSAVVRDWINRHAIWRNFVCSLLAQRLAEVIATVEEIAFKRMDMRIAEFLTDKSKLVNPVKITHQEIASELGSAREVISRILKDFEEEKIISLSRGVIQIENQQALIRKSKMV